MSITLSLDLLGSQLYKESGKVSSRTLTLEDLHQLALIQSTKDSDKLYELLQSLISDFDIYEMTYHDLEYYLHWLRISSFAFTPITIDWKCPYCGSTITSKLTNHDLVLKELDKRVPKKGYLVFKPFNSKFTKYKYKNLTVKDLVIINTIKSKVNCSEGLLKLVFMISKRSQKFLSDYLESKLKYIVKDKSTHSNNVLGLFIDEVIERIELIKKFTADDYYLIKTVEDIMSYGVEDHIIKTCDDCKKEVRVSLGELTLDSFLSRDLGESSVGTRISFESEDEYTESSEDGVDEGSMDEESIREGSQGEDGEGEATEQSAPINILKTIEDIVGA